MVMAALIELGVMMLLEPWAFRLDLRPWFEPSKRIKASSSHIAMY